MTAPNLLDELEGRLGELKSTLAIMAKYAPAPGTLCAPTLEMGLGWKAKALLPKIEAAHAALSDMAKRLEAAERDAARYRWLRDVGTNDNGWDVLQDHENGMQQLHIFPKQLDEQLDAAIDATQEGEG